MLVEESEGASGLDQGLLVPLIWSVTRGFTPNFGSGGGSVRGFWPTSTSTVLMALKTWCPRTRYKCPFRARLGSVSASRRQAIRSSSVSRSLHACEH